MAIPVKLQVFEGPLDLLLHLIEKNKIDIYDIPIVDITEQYLAYIKEMQKQDLNVVSEFLVMAATLISIKAKLLLPPEVDEDGEELDPREELVQQLLEYKMYKYMSYELKDRQIVAEKAMYKTPTLPDAVKQYRQPVNLEELFADVTLQRLQEIFEDIKKRQADKLDPVRSKFGTIEKEEVTVDEKMEYVKTYAKRNRQFSFRRLLMKQNSRMELIVTFLSILELMKTGEIQIQQEQLFDDIIITSEIAEKSEEEAE